MDTFFPSSAVQSAKPLPLLPQCGACGLLTQCRTPKLPVGGRGEKRILVITDRPNKRQDEAGKYTGASDHLQVVKEELRRHRIDLFTDCWVVGASACHTPDDRHARKAADHCRPLLIRRIEELDPSVVILLGWNPIKSVIGYLWKDDIGKEAARWQGWRIPARQLNAWVVPTYHPLDLAIVDHEVMKLRFRQDLAAAVSLSREGRPFKEVPDLRDQVRIVSADEAADFMLAHWVNCDRMVAFDFETNMLKPDLTTSSAIACCSMSDGDATIVFPWVGNAVRVFKDFLRSSTPKVASNMKFEDRWCRRRLGVAPRNWHWDTMLAAHVLDNRDGISSIKFQSFVRLGQPVYDAHVKPYLESDAGGGYGRNRVAQCDPVALMTYCGLDSLLEVLVAKHQQAEMAGTQEE